MIQLFDIFRRCARWCYRFRKRCGYGIHSPFAFFLVSGVIYESGTYYSYEVLSKNRHWDNIVLREKDDRLLFRLVNDFTPSNGVVIGEPLGITYNYLREGRKSAEWHRFTPDKLDDLPPVLQHLGQLDFLYVDDVRHTQKILNMVLPYVHNHTLIVIRHIRHNAALYQIWKWILKDERVRVTFDLYDFGLIYFEKRLNKEDYIINYF